MKLDLVPVIGLEIHIEVATKSKMFCSCPNNSKEELANKNICPICLGHPGVLPALNREAINKVLKLGLAIKGKINFFSFFDRKNYFYPDLPKAYQISQYHSPFIKGGFFLLGEKKITFDNIHLEEDTAKLSYSPDGQETFLDFNRAGIPLLEVTTQPVIDNPGQAKIFLKEFQLLVRSLGISQAAMERGEMRCDANISLAKKGEKKLFPKVEIKNLNSFKIVEAALNYEVSRQTKLWQEGKPLMSNSTRGWDEKRNCTFVQREKEESKDYRYFPEPDLPVYDVGSIVKTIRLEELPKDKRQRFRKDYGFNLEEAAILTENKTLADFVEKTISELRAWLISLEDIEGQEKEIWQKNKKKLAHLLATWTINKLLPLIDIEKEIPLTAENFSEFLILIYEKKLSSTLGTRILKQMVSTGKDVDRIMEEESLEIIDQEETLEQIINKIIEEQEDLVSLYKKGKINVIHVFVGQVMKKTKGQAKPETVRKLLEKKLS